MEINGSEVKEKSMDILKRILPNLKALKITRVVVEYDGSGDSGEVQNVNYYIGKKKAEVVDDTLDKELREACYKSLQEKNIDWYNNNGGCGSYTIDVKKKNAKLAHQVRLEEYESEDFDEEEIN